MSKSWLLIAAVVLSTAGCVTEIHPSNQPNVPSKVPFETYSNIVVLPIAVVHSDGDTNDRHAVVGMQNALSICMRTSLPTAHLEPTRASAYPPSTLLVEPVIEDMTTRTRGERLIWGPLAGSSAALMRVTFTDFSNGDVLAAPSFYAKRGPWQMTDDELMWAVVKQVCEYFAANRLPPLPARR
jgi:hypothetical protein